MLYIFEGPDGSGKTTLINAVHEATKIPILKMPSAHQYFSNHEILNALSKNYDQLLGQLANSGYDFLIDRAFLTGLVYNEAFRRGEDVSHIFDVLNQYKSDVMFFVMRADPEVIRKRKMDEVVDDKKYERIQQLYYEWSNVLFDMGLLIQHIDTESKTIEKSTEEIVDSISSMRRYL